MVASIRYNGFRLEESKQDKKIVLLLDCDDKRIINIDLVEDYSPLMVANIKPTYTFNPSAVSDFLSKTQYHISFNTRTMFHRKYIKTSGVLSNCELFILFDKCNFTLFKNMSIEYAQRSEPHIDFVSYKLKSHDFIYEDINNIYNVDEADMSLNFKNKLAKLLVPELYEKQYSKLINTGLW